MHEVGRGRETSISPRVILALFATATFFASSLLFVVQPLFAKMILPRLGGSPSVWNTCVLFFQTVLLLAYLYAHLTVRWLGPRKQALSHVGLLLLPLLVLPIGIADAAPSAHQNPTWWLLRTMAVTVGLPFFVVATMAPLVQRWFAALPVPSASDPYFLYAASNLGSMLSLLAFPFLLEPMLGSRTQAYLWVGGYAAMFIIAAVCIYSTWVFGHDSLRTLEGHADSVRWRARGWWILFAFVPSSLMLGVTTHISTDLAAVPLLWIVPLSLYLATFVLAFSVRRWLPDQLVTRLMPALALISLSSILLRLDGTIWIPVHLATFFFVAMYCHRQLALRRPATTHLTDFYLCLSVGGVLGGGFNTLIAPHLFTGIFEYPLILAAACVLRAMSSSDESQEPWQFFAVSFGMPLSVVFGAWAVGAFPPTLSFVPVFIVTAMLIAGVWAFSSRQTPFGLMITLLAALPVLGIGNVSGDVRFADRSFFGAMKVIDMPRTGQRVLQHGSTLHGQQAIDSLDRCEPLAYFHRRGPIGEFFSGSSGRIRDWAVLGLGTGALACYASPGQSLTFYEIDPMVESIATDPSLFTYLTNAPVRASIIIGDGRRLLEEANPASYDLLIMDAFSSDSVPMHLITREAIQIYVARLRPEGVLAFNISNRYLHLEPILGAIADGESLHAIAKNDRLTNAATEEAGKTMSHWVLLSREPASLSSVAALPGWHQIAPSSISPWTDDYSNILDALFPRARERGAQE